MLSGLLASLARVIALAHDSGVMAPELHLSQPGPDLGCPATVPRWHQTWVLHWILSIAAVVVVSLLASKSTPHLAFALGLPVAVLACRVCISRSTSLRRVRCVATVLWSLAFVLLTPWYFELCAARGLFLGRVPGLKLATLAHAAVFFLAPSAACGLVLMWTCQTRWMLAVCLLAALATAAQVCIAGHFAYDHPLLQLWVWNSCVLLALAVLAASGQRVPMPGLTTKWTKSAGVRSEVTQCEFAAE